MKKRKIKKNTNRDLIYILVIIFLIGYIVFLNNNIGNKIVYQKNETISNAMPNITSLSTRGFTKVNVNIEAIYPQYALVTLRSGCYIIPAHTDPYVASAIENGIKNEVNFRPTIYDVMKDIFNDYGIKVIMVKITKVENNTFFGRLYVEKDNKILSLDIRPSDATAVALRTGADVYINTTLLKALGKKIC